jgi:phospholipid/cholesterol/gamma-HCH transport system substrate-binding protein
MKLEIKVGLFVLLSLVSLFILSTQVNSFSNFNKKGYVLYAKINDTTGLDINAKIKMRGVDIGFLESKELMLDGVKLTLFLKEGIAVPTNSKIAITQDSMLGGKYVTIIPSKSTVFLNQNEFIHNYVEVASFDEAIDSINSAAVEFRNFMKTLNKTIDKNASYDLKASITNLKNASESLKNILDENRVNLKDTVSGLKLTIENINKKLPKILNQTDEMTAKFAKVGKTVNEKLPNIMTKIDSMTQRFDTTGKTINKKLPTLLTKFEGIENNITTILEENRDPLNNVLVSADGFFGSGKDTFKKLDNYFEKLLKSTLEVDISTRYMSKDSYIKTYANVNYIPIPSKYYMFSLISQNDYSDANNFGKLHEEQKTLYSVQLGKRYDNLLLRGGVIESTGGLGFDYFFMQDKLKMSAEIFDFNAVNDIRGNNAHANINFRYTVRKHLNFYLGYDNFLNSNVANAYAGVGIMFNDDDLKTLIGGGGTSFLK